MERELTAIERSFIGRILSVQMAGIESLRAQAVVARVRVISTPGVLEFVLPSSVPLFSHRDVAPLEARASDGVRKWILQLFVYGGRLSTLESFVIPDGDPTLLPEPTSFDVREAASSGSKASILIEPERAPNALLPFARVDE